MKTIKDLDEAIRALEAGKVIRTKYGHYAKAVNGLIYVAPAADKFRESSVMLTWDSFKEYYWTYGGMSAASGGRPGKDENP